MTIFTRPGSAASGCVKSEIRMAWSGTSTSRCDIGVDRHEIILALELQAVAGEINKRDRIRSRGRNLAEKFTK